MQLNPTILVSSSSPRFWRKTNHCHPYHEIRLQPEADWVLKPTRVCVIYQVWPAHFSLLVYVAYMSDTTGIAQIVRLWLLQVHLVWRSIARHFRLPTFRENQRGNHGWVIQRHRGTRKSTKTNNPKTQHRILKRWPTRTLQKNGWIQVFVKVK